jgi:shikimate dehydrogenase
VNTNLETPRKACVVGWPIAHSRSPIIHGFWLRQLGLAGSYESVAVAPPDFPGFAQNLAANGFIGANVTIPHKQIAFALCGKVTPTAASLGAVNTLWLENGVLCGDNTDVEGFLAALDEDARGWDLDSRSLERDAGGKVDSTFPHPAPGHAVVLGAGGAARAIVHALRHRGKRVLLANRTKARAESLATDAGAGVEAVDWAALPAALKGASLLVNTTSLGMKGQPPLDIDLSPLPPHAVVNDIVYFPLETALLRAARARGLRAVSGIGMLLHQAAPGFERWFGVRPSVTPELRRLVEADVQKSI